MRDALAGVAFAIAVLSGHVLDKTTGQPLAGVRISSGAAHAVTDATGRFTLRGLRPGPASVTLESDDVPPQHLTVTIGAGATERDLRACSTTLDYGCGTPSQPGAGSGAGAG